MKSRTLLLIGVGWLLQVAQLPAAEEVEFSVSFPQSVRDKPYSGRVYIFSTKRTDAQPRLAMNWFRPEPFTAVDMTLDWRGEPLTFWSTSTGAHRFPADWSELDLKGSTLQAVIRFNPWERDVTTGAGNGYSQPVLYDGGGKVSFVVDQIIAAKPYDESPTSKELVVRSELLSKFHGREIVMRGAVNVPASYAGNPTRRYPVIFNIPGFGGTHAFAPGRSSHWYRGENGPRPFTNTLGVEFIEVVLDPSCPLGHHVFADSDNNGPCGTALVTEFILALDAEYRTDSRPEARFLTGHSSGGWSSLWLQVAYPESFGGVWSTAPDPVDLRDFQRINVYTDGENMYLDREQQRRPLARVRGNVALWYDDFDRMENVLGYGGQLHSFEAVFSPSEAARRDPLLHSGMDAPPTPARHPKLLWDRKTGQIDAAVAQAWKRYDIRLILEENWTTLGPKLAGKLHVIMGTEDTFYLEGATRLLKESLERLGSDAVVELVPERDHMNLLDRQLRERIEQEMAQQYRAHTSPP